MIMTNRLARWGRALLSTMMCFARPAIACFENPPRLCNEPRDLLLDETEEEMILAVVVADGRVDSVVTDDPAQVGTEMLVIDYNTEGGTDKDTVLRRHWQRHQRPWRRTRAGKWRDDYYRPGKIHSCNEQRKKMERRTVLSTMAIMVLLEEQVDAPIGSSYGAAASGCRKPAVRPKKRKFVTYVTCLPRTLGNCGPTGF
jgi:hypothetical protein